MSRELNRDLFGETVSVEIPSRPMAKKNEAQMIATNEDVKLLGYQVDTMTKKIKEFESRMETLASKWDEFSSTAKLRFERIQGNFQRQTEALQNSFKDIHSKIATVASRTNERKMSEVGTQEMMERHQQVVQSFEARLQGLQKTISEQQYQILGLKAEMKDLLKELGKTK